MRKIRIGLIVLAIIYAVINLFFINYNDLSWSENQSEYMAVILAFIVTLGMLYSIRHDAKHS